MEGGGVERLRGGGRRGLRGGGRRGFEGETEKTDIRKPYWFAPLKYGCNMFNYPQG